VSGLQGFVADAAKKQEGRNNSKIFLLQNAEKDWLGGFDATDLLAGRERSMHQ